MYKLLERRLTRTVRRRFDKWSTFVQMLCVCAAAMETLRQQACNVVYVVLEGWRIVRCSEALARWHKLTATDIERENLSAAVTIQSFLRG